MQTLTSTRTMSQSLWSKMAAILAFVGRIRLSEQADRHSVDRGGPADSRPDCGGYNEAFVIQYWTGYNPGH